MHVSTGQPGNVVAVRWSMRERGQISTQRSHRETLNGYEITVLRGDRSIIDAIEPEWIQLCRAEPESTPFYTPEWHRAWLAAFAPAARVFLIVARRDGELRGVLPLLEERHGRRPVQYVRLRAPSNFYTGRADLVCRSDDAANVAAAIWTVLSASVRWDVLEYRDVPEHGGFARIAGIASAAGYPQIARSTLTSPYIPIRAGEDVARLGPRKHIGRAKRNLEKQGGYSYTMVTAEQEPQSIHRFLDQEASGWKGEAGTAILCDPAAAGFYRELWSAQPSSFDAVVHELKTDRGTIAIDVGFEMNGRYFGTKGSYDEEWKRVGPGHLNLHEIIVGLSTRGFTEIDLLGHHDSYKLLWTDDVRQHYHFIVFRKNLHGRSSAFLLKKMLPLAARWPGIDGAKQRIDQVVSRIRTKLRNQSTKIGHAALVLVPGGEMVRGMIMEGMLIF